MGLPKGVKRTIVFILIIAVSFLVGVIADGICTRVEYKKYARNYEQLVIANASINNIPANTLYAIIRVESGFRSNYVSEDDEIGLMQLSREEYGFIHDTLIKDATNDPGMLYDPETNIRYGAKYLGFLYDRYGNWHTAFAAFSAGFETVDAWIKDAELTDANGVLVKIPDKSVSAYVTAVQKTIKTYNRLYGEN